MSEADAGARVAQRDASVRALNEDTAAPYQGTHRLGVNRVTDMARTGTATFSRTGDTLMLRGRVERGTHWLELSGRVEPKGRNQFVLTGVVKGVPNMAWAGEAPRERRTEGSFVFEVKHGRPYWRLYRIDGRPCVCDEGCGNDFCYIDIELAAEPSITPTPQL
jgi:hypothetical protein